MKDKLKNLKFFALIACLISFQSFSAQIKFKQLLPNQNLEYYNSFLNRSETRKIISLNSNWKVYPEDNPSQKVEIAIPSSFVSSESIIYESSFNIIGDGTDNSVYRLNILGINNQAEIFLNDFSINRNSASSVPYLVYLPQELLIFGGENILKIKVSYELDSETTIPFAQRFLFPKSFGGITKEIFLEIMPPISIIIASVDAQFDNLFSSAKLNAKIDLMKNSSEEFKIHQGEKIELEIKVTDPNNNEVSRTKLALANIEKKLNVPIEIKNPELWSPESPKSYSVTVALLANGNKVDEYTKSFPLYSITLGDQLKLNGKNFEISGTTYYTSLSDDKYLADLNDLLDDLSLIKRTGFNTVRFAKDYPHPVALEMCRNLGLFALIELPLNSLPESFIQNGNFADRFSKLAETFVKEYNSYSSVLAIGLGSSFIPDSEFHMRFLETAANNFKELTSKPVYASFAGRPNSECGLDLYGIELYADELQINESESNIGASKIFISEASYPLFHGSMSGYLHANSPEAQAKYFENTFDFSRKNKIAGVVINSLFDYSGDFKSLYAGYNENQHYSLGVLSKGKNTNNISYKVLQSKLNHGSRVAIPIGTKIDDSPIFFVMTGLILAIAMGLLINSKKKFREDATRALIRPYNFFADIRDLRILSGFHTNALMLILAGAHGLLLINVLYFLKNNILLEKIIISFDLPWLINLVSFLSWNPVEAFIYLSVATACLFFIISLTLKIASFFTKTKVLFSNIYYMVIWSFLPLTILLPIKLVLYKILIADTINLYIYIFLVVYFIWLVQRIIKGIYVIFDISRSTAYFYTIGFLVILFSGLLLYFQLESSTLSFIITAYKQYQFI